jgi:hypothetical protein
VTGPHPKAELILKTRPSRRARLRHQADSQRNQRGSESRHGQADNDQQKGVSPTHSLVRKARSRPRELAAELTHCRITTGAHPSNGRVIALLTRTGHDSGALARRGNDGPGLATTSPGGTDDDRFSRYHESVRLPALASSCTGKEAIMTINRPMFPPLVPAASPASRRAVLFGLAAAGSRRRAGCSVPAVGGCRSTPGRNPSPWTRAGRGDRPRPDL